MRSLRSPLRAGRPVVLLLLIVAMPARAGGDEDLFRARVAGLLESRCLRCHGGKATKGGLSLATAEAIRAGGDSGPAIEPGRPEESLLLEMVSGDEPEMPRGGKPLSAVEVDALRRWIEAGAHWPEGVALKEAETDGPWWAVRPLGRPPVPSSDESEWARTSIDFFILKAMEEKGLRPRREADRRTLIRRLTYDIHGLPPTPEEIDAFLQDDRPDAYERLVDRLLGSPRYGERWGRHWLDVVHYGDTHGYDKDKRRDHAWPYRDYVIRAFNEDKPYGRFVREQVAGDVLFPGDPEGTIATGFIAAGPWDFVGHVELREGTVDKLKTRLIDRDDMLANTMSTFVSLTVHCARCHDHKFDPIPQKDYYRLQAVFAGVDRGDRPYASPAAAEAQRALRRERDAAMDRLNRLDQKIEAVRGPELARLDETLGSLRKQLAELPAPAKSAPGPTNGYHSAIHPRPDATAWVQVDLGASVPIEEIRLIPARPTDFPDTPGFGFPPHFRVEAGDDPTFAKPTILDDQRRPDQPNRGDEPYVLRPEGLKARYVRVTATRLWKRLEDYVFALGEFEVISGGENAARGATVSALDSIEGGRWGKVALVDGFDSRSRRPDTNDSAARRRHDLIYQIGRAERERERIAESLIDPGLRDERLAASTTLAEIDRRIKAQPTESVYAVVSHAPRPIHLLKRGDVEQPAEPVDPGSLSCVPGLESDFSASASDDEGHRRAALADWIADPRNMLTWRSVVNRIWHYHFGRGLVDTPNDFGRNGSMPTHPELLDWLAVEFRDSGGSWKALHRLILTSAAYRQSSESDESAVKIDADNRFLWRQNRRRLEAEAIRDAVLAIAGTMDGRMGGPGFEPFRFKDDHSPIYDHEAIDRINDPANWRRTVYRFAVRSVPNPFVECLDGADPNANTPVRNTTITALQALTLLNDPFMIAQAGAFARRLEGSRGDLDSRVEAAYRLALGRPPRDEERAALAGHAARYRLAATCRLIFNMNEFIFVD